MKKNDNEINIKLNSDVHTSLPKISNKKLVSSNFHRAPLKKRTKKSATKEIWVDYEGAELPVMMSKSGRKSQVVEAQKISVTKPKAQKRNVKNDKLSKFKKMISLSLLATFIFLAIYCATKVNLWRNDDIANDSQVALIQKLVEEKKVDNVEESTPSKVVENHNTVSLKDYDITKLKSVNQDTAGYIKMNGLDVDAPFVETTDNEFYLNHSFDKTVNAGGWIFGDYRNDWDNLKKNTIIYGHNRSNYKMFGSLKLIFDEKWYSNKDNHYIYISTDKANMVFEIFSAYIIPTETYYLINDFDTQEEYKRFLETISSRSTIDFGTEVGVQDKILTLSTCYTNTSKTVIHAKLVKLQNR